LAQSLNHGIGCETCHGHAEKWLARHYERDVSRAELVSLGMTDTKNLLARGKLCASCHVGSAEQDVSHDLIAAGHPPLRFELASYHDLIRHKHWDDNRERLQTRDYQGQLWASGQAASGQAALELLVARCDSATGTWPEFAEYDCFACHQRFRSSKTAPASNRKPGAPAWSTWNLAFVDSRASEHEQPLQPLRQLFAESFPPDRERVKLSVIELRRNFEPNADTTNLAGSKLLQFVQRASPDEPSWEQACQQYLALAAAERAYRDELAKQQSFAQISSADYHRRRIEHQPLAAELLLVRGWLQFQPGSPTGVLSDVPQQFYEHRHELGPRLKAIAAELHSTLAH